MPTFYVVGTSADDIKSFFSVLPEEDRPKVVSDKEFPGAWEHPSDKPVVIATEEPRTDVEAKELVIANKQADEVLSEMTGDQTVTSEDPAVQVPEPEEEKEPIRGPHTYADRGFRVGRLV